MVEHDFEHDNHEEAIKGESYEHHKDEQEEDGTEIILSL